ncbi:helix-turn-helix domain-containing protein [Streptomyces sp. NPDC057963]|uniref:helix-turn-helix domain-containing protein n=1 Tax=Streptomyces sp. NPDC057963 TaxID=3346290 RepID=UPI0036EEE235
MVVEDRVPDPREARSAAEFVALLRLLKDASGLTFRELTQRADAAGEVLPRSTIANMLGRTSVPREELLAAFARACGCGPAAVQDWLAVRKELAVHGRRGGGAGGAGEVRGTGGAEGVRGTGGAGDVCGTGGAGDVRGTGGPEDVRGTGGVGEVPVVPPERSPEPPAGASPARRRRQFRNVLVAAASLLVLAAAAVTVAVLARDEEPGSPSVAGPVAGRTVQIRSVHSGLCLSEKRGSDSGRLYQVPCDGETLPSFSLRPLGDGVWRIATEHPDYGPGCAGVWNGMREGGAPMQDQECGRRGSAEAFRIEPRGHPAEGYRIRPTHTRLCVGAVAGSGERGTEMVQRGCDGSDRGSLFSFDPVATDGPAALDAVGG